MNQFPTSSLYVGDLVPDVTEALLFETFSAAGPVASIRVCRDAVTRRSLGYAYVNYHNVVDAERALDTLNYAPIKGHPCRIMWSQRDPSARKKQSGNVFIKNLDPTIDNKSLYDTFSAFGNIQSCKVAQMADGRSRGFGFVHFESEKSAITAIEKVNGMAMNGKVVYVGEFQPRKERERDPSMAKFTNVFLKNLDESISEAQLKEMVEEFGPVTSLVIQKKEDGTSKGFGFVNFDEAEHALAAIETLNGKEVAGKAIYAARAQKKAERSAELSQKFERLKTERQNKYQGVNLYVKNLDDTVTDERLRQEFQPFGTITSATVMRDDKSKQSKGFGFVCFSHPDEATKAVTEMNGHLIDGKPIYVALAQRKDVRRMQLEAQYAQRQSALRQVPQTPSPGQIPGPVGYAPGSPVFYPPQQAGIPPAFMAGYPPQILPGRQPRWNAQGMQQQPRPGTYGQMANYMMPMAGPRGQRQVRPVPGPQPGQAMGGGVPKTRGFRYTPNARNRDQPLQPVQPAPQVSQIPANAVQAAGISGAEAPVAVAAVPVGAPAAVPAAAGAVSGAEFPQLTPSTLAAASPQQQKQLLGDSIFPLVTDRQPELAGKITGMLLDMDNSELLHLIEDPAALDAKVNEALGVLRKFHAEQEGAVVAGDGEAGEPEAQAQA